MVDYHSVETRASRHNHHSRQRGASRCEYTWNAAATVSAEWHYL
jgi:hypothetical protein